MEPYGLLAAAAAIFCFWIGAVATNDAWVRDCNKLGMTVSTGGTVCICHKGEEKK